MVIARSGFVPVYKGPKPCGMVICHHWKIFSEIRQKTTNGRLAVTIHVGLFSILAPDVWRLNRVTASAGVVRLARAHIR